MIGNAIDSILSWLTDLVVAVLLLLPESPLRVDPADLGSFYLYLQYINYFVPIGAMLGILTAYLVAVLVWYGYRWFLRIARYIE